MARKKDLKEVAELLKAYARQELLDPLAAAPRWLAMGIAGSLMVVLGSVSVLLAVLRALQTETGTALAGNLSWIPYLVTGAVLAAGIYATIRGINKRSLG